MHLLTFDQNGHFSLVHFPNSAEVPAYAILSHTWYREDAEPSFQDLQNGIRHNKRGFAKLRFCAAQAYQDNINYFWIDTCCIDKTNNNELTTAINSMYRWYQNAVVCYVFLADVTGARQPGDPFWHQGAWLHGSRWFQRGWTLQELLAPKKVDFYSRDHVYLGDRTTLQQKIMDITGIPAAALHGTPLTEFSIDERFSWAANRQTTREEDRVYCLLGIFGVHLPLIYGEGFAHAQRRLKREILANEENLTENTATGGSQSDTWGIPRANSSTLEVATPNIDPITRTAYVAIIGYDGSGKRPFINLLTGANIATNTESRQSLQSYDFVYQGYNRVHLIETPGINHEPESLYSVAQKLYEYMRTLPSGSRLLDGIICLHSILHDVPEASLQPMIAWRRRLCGPASSHKFILVNTFLESVERKAATEAERKLVAPAGLWRYFHELGSPMIRHSGSLHSALTVLDWVLLPQ